MSSYINSSIVERLLVPMSSASTAEKLLRDIVRKIAHYFLFIAAGIKQVKETRKRLERKERALESEMCPICADVLK